MKQFIILILLLILPLVNMGNYSLAEGIKNAGNWEPVKNSDGISTYVRWIVTEKNTKTRERKGEFVVESGIEEIINILTDSKATSKWMKNISVTYELKRVNKDEWYTYTLFDIPWPFNNRDLVSNVKLNSDSEENNSTISMISREDYIPPKPKIIRLTDYSAKWYIKSLGNNKVRITFTAITDSPPMFPRWIQDPVLENMFHNNLVNLKGYIYKNQVGIPETKITGKLPGITEIFMQEQVFYISPLCFPSVANIPPSTYSICPFTKPEAFEERNIAAP